MKSAREMLQGSEPHIKEATFKDGLPAVCVRMYHRWLPSLTCHRQGLWLGHLFQAVEIQFIHVHSFRLSLERNFFPPRGARQRVRVRNKTT